MCLGNIEGGIYPHISEGIFQSTFFRVSKKSSVTEVKLLCVGKNVLKSYEVFICPSRSSRNFADSLRYP